MKLTKQQFKNLTTTRKTNYGVFYSTITKICKYGQAALTSQNDYTVDDYVDSYYRIYLIDFDNN